MSRQAQTICPCSGWSRDVGSSIHQPPLMLPQWHGFLFRVCSLSLRFWQEPVPQGSGLQLCMAGASNSLSCCSTWGTATPAYQCTYVHTYIRTYVHTYIRTYVHTYIRRYVDTYIHIYIHAYMHTYMHTYKHICIHIYIHTHLPAGLRRPPCFHLGVSLLERTRRSL